MRLFRCPSSFAPPGARPDRQVGGRATPSVASETRAPSRHQATEHPPSPPTRDRAGASPAEDGLDTVGRKYCRLVFPHAKYVPTSVNELAVVAAVAPDIVLELLSPPVAIGDRLRAMRGAAMPEASVDEHCQSGAREDDVCFAANAGKRLVIDPVAQTPAVQLTA